MAVTKYIAARGGHWITKDGTNVRFEAGDVYKGPDPERLCAEGIVFPAPDAGSRQPGISDEGGMTE